jgi:Tfp pilus assembly protein PilV
MTMHTRRHAGVSLIEAIAAIVILSVAVPSMMFGLREAQRTRANPILGDRARFLAIERLETVLADRHSTTRGYSYVVTGAYPTESPVADFPGMTRSTSIVETGPPPTFAAGTGTKTVIVTVNYLDSRGAAQAVSISTIISDYTP